MDDSLSAVQLATSGMRAQAQRLRHVSENVANVDTPGYRRKMVTFEEQLDFGRPTGAVSVSKPILDRSDLPEVYDPANPLANENGFYAGSNVNLVVEIADSREAARSYEANLRVFEQSRQMSSSLMDLLRN